MYSDIDEELENKNIKICDIETIIGSEHVRDSNNSRLRKLIKISNIIYNYKELYESDFLIPLYIFKNINKNTISKLFEKMKLLNFHI